MGFDVIAVTARTNALATALAERLAPFGGGASIVGVADPSSVVPIGSGGATLNALLVVAEDLSARAGFGTLSAAPLRAARVLILHVGGAARGGSPHPCLPQALTPLPLKTGMDDDEGEIMCGAEWALQLCQQMFADAPPGVTVASTDSLLTMPPATLSGEWLDLGCVGDAAACVGAVIALPTPATLASSHGVCTPVAPLPTSSSWSQHGPACGTISYRASPAELKKVADGAGLGGGMVPIFTGIVWFSSAGAEALLDLHVRSPLDACTYIGIDSGAAPLYLDLHSDLLGAMLSSTDRDTYLSAPQSPTRTRAREVLWSSLRAARGGGLRLCTAPAGTYTYCSGAATWHRLLLSPPADLAISSSGDCDLDQRDHAHGPSQWLRSYSPHHPAASTTPVAAPGTSQVVLCSLLADGVRLGDRVVLEHCALQPGTIVGPGTLLSGVTSAPPGVTWPPDYAVFEVPLLPIDGPKLPSRVVSDAWSPARGALPPSSAIETPNALDGQLDGQLDGPPSTASPFTASPSAASPTVLIIQSMADGLMAPPPAHLLDRIQRGAIATNNPRAANATMSALLWPCSVAATADGAPSSSASPGLLWTAQLFPIVRAEGADGGLGSAASWPLVSWMLDEDCASVPPAGWFTSERTSFAVAAQQVDVRAMIAVRRCLANRIDVAAVGARLSGARSVLTAQSSGGSAEEGGAVMAVSAQTVGRAVRPLLSRMASGTPSEFESLLTSLDSVAAHATPLVAARTFAAIADALALRAAGMGGLRSGPAANAAWSSALHLLRGGELRLAVNALAVVRRSWLGSGDGSATTVTATAAMGDTMQVRPPHPDPFVCAPTTFACATTTFACAPTTFVCAPTTFACATTTFACAPPPHSSCAVCPAAADACAGVAPLRGCGGRMHLTLCAHLCCRQAACRPARAPRCVGDVHRAREDRSRRRMVGHAPHLLRAWWLGDQCGRERRWCVSDWRTCAPHRRAQDCDHRRPGAASSRLHGARASNGPQQPTRPRSPAQDSATLLWPCLAARPLRPLSRRAAE